MIEYLQQFELFPFEIFFSPIYSWTIVIFIFSDYKMCGSFLGICVIDQISDPDPFKYALWIWTQYYWINPDCVILLMVKFTVKRLDVIWICRIIWKFSINLCLFSSGYLSVSLSLSIYLLLFFLPILSIFFLWLYHLSYFSNNFFFFDFSLFLSLIHFPHHLFFHSFV